MKRPGGKRHRALRDIGKDACSRHARRNLSIAAATSLGRKSNNRFVGQYDGTSRCLAQVRRVRGEILSSPACSGSRKNPPPLVVSVLIVIRALL